MGYEAYILQVLTCDNENCHERFRQYEVSTFEFLTEALEAGWVIKKKTKVCPTCSTTVNKGD